MRLLHTADWHLGRSFHGVSLEAAHEAVIDRLIEAAREHRPDAIIVAGDVFDRAYPPVSAVELYDDALARLATLGIPAVITSGNHDSAIRLGMGARAAERAGIFVRTRTDRLASPVLVGDPAAPTGLIYAIPYLDPATTAPALGATEVSHQAVLAAAMRLIADDRAARPPVPAAVVAHGVVAGGVASRAEGDVGGGSAERSIDVGGVSAVDREVFGTADYVALGHLHRPQSLGRTIRYSGAPLALSFSETGDAKSFSLVDVATGAAPQVTELPVPAARALARLRGKLEELLADPAHAAAESAWVEATLTDPLRPARAMDRLRARFPHVVKLEHAPVVTGDAGSEERYSERVRGRSPLEIAGRFLGDVLPGAPADEHDLALLREAFETTGAAQALR